MAKQKQILYFIKIIPLFLFLSIFSAKEPFQEFKIKKNYFPEYIYNSNIKIDGKLDDLAWENALIINDFVQVKPIYNSNPSKKTDVKVLYDDDALYIGVNLFDNLENIVVRKSQYDDWEGGFENKSDYFVVEIDSRHDHQTSYGFAINSYGSKADYMLHNDNTLSNDDWNAIWDADVDITDNGWTIEYKIPFNILKYHDNDDMGINFIRYIQRNNELIYWVLLSEELDGVISHYGHINTLKLTNKDNLIVKPYILYGNTKFNNTFYDYDNFSQVEYNSQLKNNKLGFDINYQFSSSFSVDYTFKPDFGQIEQDPSMINLTAYEPYFDEKRTFFTTNSSFFYSPINIFYSRRLGGNVSINNDNYSSSIDNAIKISGKRSSGIAYSSIFSQSSLDDYRYNIKSFINRISRDILNGNSYVGVMNTVYKSPDNLSKVYSFDGLINLLNNNLRLDGQSAVSQSGDTRGMGHSYEVSFTKKTYSNISEFFNHNIFDTWINIEKYDENFNINHLGYLYRNNFIKTELGFALTKKNPSEDLLERFFNIRLTRQGNMQNSNLKNYYSFNWDFIFKNYWQLGFSYLKQDTYYDDWLLSNFHILETEITLVKKPASQQFQLSVTTNPLRDISFEYDLFYFSNGLNDYGNNYSLSMELKPKDWLLFGFYYEIKKYKDKYHFLLSGEYINIPIADNTPLEIMGSIYSDDNIFNFSDSKIFERHISLSTSYYLRNDFSIKMFMEYFTYSNNFSNNYAILKDNYSYPNVMVDITQEEKNIDMLIYNANYSSLQLNYILEWNNYRKLNLYLIFSMYKGINGKRFSNILNLLEYKINNESTDLTEIFFDKSIYLKLEFLLNN